MINPSYARRRYVYDVETGLYYLRSRYYQPAWNRFINADKAIGLGCFVYCNNNAIVFLDDDGDDPSIATMREKTLLYNMVVFKVIYEVNGWPVSIPHAGRNGGTGYTDVTDIYLFILCIVRNNDE